MGQINNVTTNVNPYDLYRYCYHENYSADDVNFMGWSKKLSAVQKRRGRSLMQNLGDGPSDPEGIPCIDTMGCHTYWNNKDNRKAFNVDYNGEWLTCSNDTRLNYTSTPGESIQFYPDLLASGLKILVYSGDTDSAVPVTGTRAWINDLKQKQNLTETEEWRQWTLGGQVAGYTFTLNDTFRFATIKGTGHMSI